MQCPSVVDPDIDAKIETLHLLAEAGVDSVNIGLPGAGPRPYRDAVVLAKEIVDNRLPIRPAAAARTVVADIAPIASLSQEVGIEVEVMTFIGSSRSGSTPRTGAIRSSATERRSDLVRGLGRAAHHLRH